MLVVVGSGVAKADVLVSGGNGIGDAVVGGTQTWTGTNTYSQPILVSSVTASIYNGAVRLRLQVSGSASMEETTNSGQLLYILRSLNSSVNTTTGQGSALMQWRSADAGSFMTGALSGANYVIAKISQPAGTIGAGAGNPGTTLLDISTTTKGTEVGLSHNGGGGLRAILKDLESPAGELEVQFSSTTFKGIVVSSGPAPALTSCGGSPAVRGTNVSFTITGGSASGGCTATFNPVYVSTPVCIVSQQTMSLINALSYTLAPSSITITQAALGTNKLDIHCWAIAP